MALQKIGYEGVLDVRAGRGRGATCRARSRAARARAARAADGVLDRATPRRRPRTMTTVRIQDIAKHEGEQVTIHGWLHNRRSSGKIHFLQVRDGSGFIQAVMSKAAVGDERRSSRPITCRRRRRSVVTGTVRADARAPGGFEIDVNGARGASRSRTTTPSRRRSTASTTCWIAATSGFDRQRQQAILRVRHEVINAVRDYFNSRGLHPRATRRSSRRRPARARRRCSRSSTSRTRRRT